jgi:hypothetical protein
MAVKQPVADHRSHHVKYRTFSTNGENLSEWGRLEPFVLGAFAPISQILTVPSITRVNSYNYTSFGDL